MLKSSARSIGPCLSLPENPARLAGYARFQIEFIFRDVKQFTGLCDSQARDPERLNFHFNASLTTLNLAKLEHLQAQSDTEPMAFSMASVKACYSNAYFIQKIFSMLGFDPSWIEKSPEYQNCGITGNYPLKTDRTIDACTKK